MEFFKPEDFKECLDVRQRIDSAAVANKRLSQTGLIEAAVNVMQKSAVGPGPTMRDFYRLGKALEYFGFKFC